MSEKEVRIRIIHKSKEGVILDMKDQGKKSVPWDTFNKMFLIKDNVWAVFNEETKKKREQFDELMNDLCIQVMMHQADEKRGDNSNFLTHMGMIGTLSEKIQKEFGFTAMQVIQEARKRIAIFRDPNIPFFEKETPQEYRERHARQAEEKAKRERDERSYRQGTISNATESMANVKGADKLKDLFKV